MIVRNVQLVMRRAQLAVLVSDRTTECPDHHLSHLQFPLLQFLLCKFIKETNPGIPSKASVHHFNHGLNIHLPPESLQHRLSIHKLGVGSQATGAIQERRTNVLGCDNDLIHCLIFHAQTCQRLLHVSQKTIKFIVGQSNAFVDLNQVCPLVHLRSSQELCHIHVLPFFHLLQVLPAKLGLQAIVHRNQVVQTIDELRDTLLSTKTFEQPILALLHVLFGQLHSNSTACREIFSNLPSRSNNIFVGIWVHAKLSQAL
mmetsp:Transcript_44201/g.94105  ORF Transcript_44201/g.94105 Transcript_44201/m.94105 type:complete len:257 (-) Transcript_44201:133-903(-)